ncbi:hypothetical protein CE91St44_12140 [Oscillospiraceae bacterium]|nr:hypothetical protein CE91St44_12140 [Oscillospiraceae bacterium]
MTHNRKHLLPALGCCLLAAAALWLLFCFDNKYTARAPLAQDGALILETGALERGTLAWPCRWTAGSSGRTLCWCPASWARARRPRWIPTSANF